MDWLRVLKISLMAVSVAIYVFIGSVLYSVLNVKVALGDTVVLTRDTSTVIEIPCDVTNNGFYSLTDLKIGVKMEGTGGSPALSNSTEVTLIKAGESWRGRLILIIDETTARTFYEKGYDVLASFEFKYAEPMLSLKARLGPV